MPLTCALAGHRPNAFPYGFDEEHPDCQQLKLLLLEQIAGLISNGVTTFVTQMYLGVGTWAAEAVLALGKQQPRLRLVAALPYEGQASRWTPEQRDRYFGILEQCDDVITINRKYSIEGLHECDRWMIDHSQFLLVAYYGLANRDISLNPLQYALEKKLLITAIRADSMRVYHHTITANT